MTDTQTDLMHTALGELVSEGLVMYPPDPPQTITLTRFPFTYAYDCLRVYPKLVPAEFRNAGVDRGSDYDFPPTSRQASIPIVRAWGESLGLQHARLCVALAFTYVKLQGMQMRMDRYDEVIEMIEAGANDAEISSTNLT